MNPQFSTNINQDDIDARIRQIKTLLERQTSTLRGNPVACRRFLIDVGIWDQNGQLSKRYQDQ